MDKRTTVFLAKKLFTELVFNTAYIEGVNVTFPQTQTILDGGIVNQVPVSDIQTVLNLRDAWRYCINNFESTTNYDFLCKINEMVSRNESLAWGSLRTGKVGISGTEYRYLIRWRKLWKVFAISFIISSFGMETKEQPPYLRAKFLWKQE